MKITTKMKRHATSERGWKRSKSITSNTKLITGFLDFDKPETMGKKRKRKKDKRIYAVGDVLRISARYLYSPHVDKKSIWHQPLEEELSLKVREFARMWWRSYQTDIIVDRVVVEWKYVTYYWEYAWLKVAFDNRFSNYQLVGHVNNESEESNWDTGEEA